MNDDLFVPNWPRSDITRVATDSTTQSGALSVCERATHIPYAMSVEQILELAEADRADEIRTLLEEHPVLVNAHDDSVAGHTPLIKAVSRAQGGRKTALILLRMGADVNKGSSNGVTPLMWAASVGNSPCVELLLDRGARTDLRASAGPWKTDTALIIAKKSGGNDRCVRLIQKAAEKQAASSSASASPTTSGTPPRDRIKESPPSQGAPLHAGNLVDVSPTPSITAPRDAPGSIVCQ
jgi:ankyrin repeat protein